MVFEWYGPEKLALMNFERDFDTTAVGQAELWK